MGSGEGQKKTMVSKKKETERSRWPLLARRYLHLHKPAQKCGQNHRRARYTDTPGFQGQDGRSLGPLSAPQEKNMARYARGQK